MATISSILTLSFAREWKRVDSKLHASCSKMSYPAFAVPTRPLKLFMTVVHRCPSVAG